MVYIFDFNFERGSALELLLGESLGLEAQVFGCSLELLDAVDQLLPDGVILVEDTSLLSTLDCIRALLKVHNTLPTVVLSRDLVSPVDYLSLGAEEVIALSSQPEEVALRIKRTGIVSSKAVNSTSDALIGSLRHMELLDFIQLLSSGRKNGVLSLLSDSSTASLYFREGQLIHAHVGSTSGEPAFTEIVRIARNDAKGVHQVQLSFSSDLPAKIESTIKARTDHLLLSVANTLDEE